MRYDSPNKPKNCPRCGSTQIADIMYGMAAMSEELEDNLRSGKVVLGGCVITADDPKWQCAECNAQIYPMPSRRSSTR